MDLNCELTSLAKWWDRLDGPITYSCSNVPKANEGGSSTVHPKIYTKNITFRHSTADLATL